MQTLQICRSDKVNINLHNDYLSKFEASACAFPNGFYRSLINSHMELDVYIHQGQSDTLKLILSSFPCSGSQDSNVFIPHTV